MGWRDQLSDREIREVAFARTYVDDFNHGTPGHNHLVIIAKLANLLDEKEKNDVGVSS